MKRPRIPDDNSNAGHPLEMKWVQPTNDVMFRKNLTAIRKRYPHYADALEKAPIGVEYRVAVTGETHTYNAFQVSSGRYYYDTKNTHADVKEQIAALKLRNARVAVFLGFGLGFLPDYYLKQEANNLKTKFVVLVEKNFELFRTAISLMDYSHMLGADTTFLMLGENPDDMLALFEKIFKDVRVIALLKCVKPVYHASSLAWDKEYYLQALRKVSASVLYVIGLYGNSPEDSLVGVENMLDNLDEIVNNPGVNLLYGKFAGKPAIVVSTGPSLNKNKHLLKGLEDKALILCPDASLNILLAAGVKPHVITALERVKESAELIEGHSEAEVADIFYAGAPVVPNLAYQVYPGPRLIVYRNLDHFKWLGIDRGILDIKQSSGNMAFKVAEALGCDPIILVGQDLAFSRDGKTHAAGTTYGEDQRHLDVKGFSEQFEVMGNDGSPILTMSTWNDFREAYELDIAGYAGRCINSTEGGAYIKGTTVMPLEDSIEQYVQTSYQPLSLIREHLSSFSADRAEEDKAQVLSLLSRTLCDLGQMTVHCQEGIAEIRSHQVELMGLLESAQPSLARIHEIVDRILAHKNSIIHIQPTMQLLLMHIIQSFHIKFEMDMFALWNDDEAEGKSLIKVGLSQVKWFSVIHDIIRICEQSLNRALEKLSSEGTHA